MPDSHILWWWSVRKHPWFRNLGTLNVLRIQGPLCREKICFEERPLSWLLYTGSWLKKKKKGGYPVLFQNIGQFQWGRKRIQDSGSCSVWEERRKVWFHFCTIRWPDSFKQRGGYSRLFSINRWLLGQNLNWWCKDLYLRPLLRLNPFSSYLKKYAIEPLPYACLILNEAWTV